MKCTCGHPDDYNYAIDNGLCNSCIEEKLEQLQDELETANRHIGWLKGDKISLNRSIKVRDGALGALIDMNEKNEKQLRGELNTAEKRVAQLKLGFIKRE